MNDTDALKKRIAELESENAALKAQLPTPDPNVFKCEFCESGKYERTGFERVRQLGCGSHPMQWRCTNVKCGRLASEFRSQELDRITLVQHLDNPPISND